MKAIIKIKDVEVKFDIPSKSLTNTANPTNSNTRQPTHKECIEFMRETKRLALQLYKESKND